MTNITYSDFDEADWPEIWTILKPTFWEGASYPCAINISEDDARQYWIDTPQRTIVARDQDGTIIGTFYIRPDQGGLGNHICNCGYVVSKNHRGKGIAVAMCLHSQNLAKNDGFSGMKFNLVVAVNKPAIRAWKKCGLEIIGTTPNAFRHKNLGFVDAHIMYRPL